MTSRQIQPLTCADDPSAARAAATALQAALDGGPAVLPVPPGEPGRRLLAALRPELPEAQSDTALIVPTSGSTGEAKGVLLSTSAITASARATHARLGGPGRWLLALPVRHIAGLQVVTRSLLAGTQPGVLDLSNGYPTEAFASAARDVLAGDGPHYTALVPTQLARLVGQAGAGLDALREFDGVLLGGAATPPALLERAITAGVRIVTTYGMSETAGGCVYDGLALDGVTVRLIDELDNADDGQLPCDEGHPRFSASRCGTSPSGDGRSGASRSGDGRLGRIELAGPMLATGYRLRPDDTASAFPNGWFRTGDLGRWTDSGRLEVLGRADDMIITGGLKVAPALVERVLTAQPGVLEACVLGVPDPEWGHAVVAAVVPADAAQPPRIGALLQAVRTSAGRAATPKVVRFLDALPLRGPGKVDRQALGLTFAEPP
jgi:O-succinylbenzoic acid--CoA ligase